MTDKKPAEVVHWKFCRMCGKADPYSVPVPHLVPYGLTNCDGVAEQLTYRLEPDTPTVTVRQWKFEHLDLGDAHVTTMDTVLWLDHVFQFLQQAGRDEWVAEAVPVPPWRQQ